MSRRRKNLCTAQLIHKISIYVPKVIKSAGNDARDNMEKVLEVLRFGISFLTSGGRQAHRSMEVMEPPGPSPRGGASALGIASRIVGRAGKPSGSRARLARRRGVPASSGVSLAAGCAEGEPDAREDH